MPEFLVLALALALSPSPSLSTVQLVSTVIRIVRVPRGDAKFPVGIPYILRIYGTGVHFILGYSVRGCRIIGESDFL